LRIDLHLQWQHPDKSELPDLPCPEVALAQLLERQWRRRSVISPLF
jgi:hypothetical protein